MIGSAVAVPNTSALPALSHISCGTALTSPARVAPAPSAASTAGSTQHTSVAALASVSASTRVASGMSWPSLSATANLFFLKAHIHVGCRRELP